MLVISSGGVHASGALVTVKQLGLQLVFCVEIISSPLLAQGSIRVLHHKSHVFLLGKGAPNALAFLWWHSFFGIVTLCKGAPLIHWKAQDGDTMSYGTETFDLRESHQ